MQKNFQAKKAQQQYGNPNVSLIFKIESKQQQYEIKRLDSDEQKKEEEEDELMVFIRQEQERQLMLANQQNQQDDEPDEDEYYQDGDQQNEDYGDENLLREQDNMDDEFYDEDQNSQEQYQNQYENPSYQIDQEELNYQKLRFQQDFINGKILRSQGSQEGVNQKNWEQQQQLINFINQNGPDFINQLQMNLNGSANKEFQQNENFKSSENSSFKENGILNQSIKDSEQYQTNIKSDQKQLNDKNFGKAYNQEIQQNEKDQQHQNLDNSKTFSTNKYKKNNVQQRYQNQLKNNQNSIDLQGMSPNLQQNLNHSKISQQNSNFNEYENDKNFLAPLQQKNNLIIENFEKNQLLEELERQKKLLQKSEDKVKKKNALIQEMQNIQNDLTQIKNIGANNQTQFSSIPQEIKSKNDKQELEEKVEQIEIENRILKARLSEMESQLHSLSTNIVSSGPGPTMRAKQGQQNDCSYQAAPADNFYNEMHQDEDHRKNTQNVKPNLQPVQSVSTNFIDKNAISENSVKFVPLRNINNKKLLQQNLPNQSPYQEKEDNNLKNSKSDDFFDFSSSQIKNFENQKNNSVNDMENLQNGNFNQYYDDQDEFDQQSIYQNHSIQQNHIPMNQFQKIPQQYLNQHLQKQFNKQNYNQPINPQYNNQKQNIQNQNLKNEAISGIQKKLQKQLNFKNQDVEQPNFQSNQNQFNTASFNKSEKSNGFYPKSQNARPVQILISPNESQQIALLNERCHKLETYCKDLIRTNKILDLENKLCIQQILKINNQSQGGPRQLNNFVSALHMLRK